MMISIVVPIYNAGKYLEECVKSLLCQTYHDIEIILIDDGSTDNSFHICQKYAEEDERVRIFSIRNSGANAARGVGVSRAKGKYIMFVDADDTIADDALENFANIINKDSMPDIVVAHMLVSYKKVPGYQHLIDLLQCSSRVEMCFKIYKASILKSHFIDIPRSLKYGEDLLQNINLSRYVSNVVYCNLEYYNYRMVETSISHTMQFCQDYENEYHKFLSTLLFESSFVGNLSEEFSLNLKMAWWHCRINGLKNVVQFSNKFNFRDSDYLQMKSQHKPYISYLNIDEKILFYSPSCISLFLLNLYIYYCNLKGDVKKSILKMKNKVI